MCAGQSANDEHTWNKFLSATHQQAFIIQRYGLEITGVHRSECKHLEQIFVNYQHWRGSSYEHMDGSLHIKHSIFIAALLGTVIYSPAIEIRYTMLGDLIMHAIVECMKIFCKLPTSQALRGSW